MYGRSELITSSLADADAARRDHDQPLQVERLLRRFGETRDLVEDRPDLVVVDVVEHHLAAGAGAADQAGEMHGHVDQAAAVVAQVEHQLGRAGRLQRRKRVVERGRRRLHEIAEEQVADPAAVDVDDAASATRSEW